MDQGLDLVHRAVSSGLQGSWSLVVWGLGEQVWSPRYRALFARGVGGSE